MASITNTVDSTRYQLLPEKLGKFGELTKHTSKSNGNNVIIDGSGNTVVINNPGRLPGIIQPKPVDEQTNDKDTNKIDVLNGQQPDSKMILALFMQMIGELVGALGQMLGINNNNKVQQANSATKLDENYSDILSGGNGTKDVKDVEPEKLTVN